MGKFSVKASLALWRRRLKYRSAKVRSHSRRGNRTYANRWRKLEAEALRNVQLRKKQANALQPLRRKALEQAKKLVGVMEEGGNNRGPKVMAIIRANGGTGPEPWCGDFVAYCYRLAGSTVVSRPWAAVRYLGYLTGQRVLPVAQAQPGDIVCFTFDHTGLFVRWEQGGKVAICIEGNTGGTGARSDSATGGDGVYVKERQRSQISRVVRVER